MSHFLIEFKKWSEAYSDALSVINDETQGEVDDVDFRFGPPRRSGLPCFIIINGREQPLFELSDINPPFKELRSWMERATQLSSLSRLAPEMISLDCGGHEVTLSLIPASWEGRNGTDMLSLFVVTESGCAHPLVKSFCRSFRTVGRLYCALMEMTRNYERDFSDPSRWKDSQRFDPMEERSCAERMREELHSETVELRTRRAL